MRAGIFQSFNEAGRRWMAAADRLEMRQSGTRLGFSDRGTGVGVRLGCPRRI